MADIETSIVISANTDDLQSGIEAAANSVQAATDAIRAQFTGLGAAAQQMQLQISTTSAEVGSSIGALQARAAGLTGSIGDGLIPSISMGGAARNERDQLNELSADQKVTDAKFANYKALIHDEAALGQFRSMNKFAKSKISSISNGLTIRPITRKSSRRHKTIPGPKKN